MSYICEKSVGPERSCDFRSGKVILQQEITAAQMTKLLTTGRTDLLDGFVSSRTNRKFKAFLSRGEDGKVGFEFEARPERPGARRPGAAAAKVASKTARKTSGATDAKPAAKKAAARKSAVKSPAKKAARKVTKVAAKKVAG